MSYSNFNTFKLFQNVGINSSGDYMLSMKPNDNNVSFHSSNSIDYNNVDIMSIKNIINKKQNEDLNLSSLNGTTINPVITINNNLGDCRIKTNLNIEQNLNIVCKTGGSKLKIINNSTNTYAGIGWFRNELEAKTESHYRGYIHLGRHNSTMYLRAKGEIELISDTGKVYVKDSYLGIKTNDPKFPLDVVGHDSMDHSAINGDKYYYIGRTSVWTSAHGGPLASNYDFSTVSARFQERIWVNHLIFFSSDTRIKTNIVDVPDSLALQQLRSIPCRYYEYIDKLNRGPDKTIGFIAQEVKSIMPMAVTQQKEIIPNVYKVINCTWTSVNGKFIMSSNDLTNVNDVKYKFYVSNASDANDEKRIEIIGNSDNTFTFDTQYTNVFCYGSEVDDFHIVDKNKLFTLNFSATQEIDRIQQTHITEIASLKAENTELKTKLNELTNKIKNATTFEDLKNSL